MELLSLHQPGPASKREAQSTSLAWRLDQGAMVGQGTIFSLVANIGDSTGADTRSLRKIRISAVVASVVINLHHIQVTPEVKTHFLFDIKIFVKICMKYSTL